MCNTLTWEHIAVNTLFFKNTKKKTTPLKVFVFIGSTKYDIGVEDDKTSGKHNKFIWDPILINLFYNKILINSLSTLQYPFFSIKVRVHIKIFGRNQIA